MAIKVYELASELGVSISTLTDKAKKLKINNLLMATSLSAKEEMTLRMALSTTKSGAVLKKNQPMHKSAVVKKISAKPEHKKIAKPTSKETAESLKDAINLNGATKKDHLSNTQNQATFLKDNAELQAETSVVTADQPNATDDLLTDNHSALEQKDIVRTEFSKTGVTAKKATVSQIKNLESETIPSPNKRTKAKILEPTKLKTRQAIKIIRKNDVKAPNDDDNAYYTKHERHEFKTYKPIRKNRHQFDSEDSKNLPYKKRYLAKNKSNLTKQVKTLAEQRKKDISIPKIIQISELSNITGLKANEIIKTLMEIGVIATINQTIDSETAQLVCNELGVEVKIDNFDVESLLDKKDRVEKHKKRPPVVTIMGHVDHGKTSLLDKIRQTDVVAKEAGGITQHIGAYFVETEAGGITFLDTPGHEAFTEMRARGANATDIVILVIAADDGPKPQTIEAISHAKAAKVPILVAINKCDKPDANPDKTKEKLLESGLVAESYGGDVTMVNVSAKTGKGINELLNLTILQAETMNLTADGESPAQGIVIESRLDKVKGNVISLIVQHGVLKLGDYLIAGTAIGRVRAMIDHNGHKVDKALPSYPVEVLGINKLPQSGDKFIVTPNEKVAKLVKNQRTEIQQAAEIKNTPKVRMEDLFNRIQTEDKVVLSLILKTDMQGSLEAVKKALQKWESPKISLEYLHASTGAITSSDVALASASNAIIIGFNVRPDSNAKLLSEKENVQIQIYNVIYDIIDDVKSSLEGMMAPIIHQQDIGKGEVLSVFTIPKVGVVAGCKITDGKVTNDCKMRLIRDNIVLHSGKIKSLKRFKEPTKEVFEGFECGIMPDDNYKDIKTSDTVEFFIENKAPPKLS